MDKIRDFAIGVTGFFASITLKQWTELGSAAAGWATAIYMTCRIVDWIIGKINKKKEEENGD